MSDKLYWHFAKTDNDGNPIMRDETPIVVGRRYEIVGEIKMCARGYHGSLRALDALRYASDCWVSRRPLEGAIDGADKSVGRAFVQQSGIDATEILREFARWCALQVVHLWDAPDVVRQYIEAGNASLRASARHAANDAAWAAVSAAANAVAWAAASAAANAVAWAAAWASANAAAWDAASAAAHASANAAAWDAARHAAWDAAWERYSHKLESMLVSALQESGNE